MSEKIVCNHVEDFLTVKKAKKKKKFLTYRLDSVLQIHFFKKMHKQHINSVIPMEFSYL